MLGLQELDRERITAVLDAAETFRRPAGAAPARASLLRGRTVANLFYEPSTRTRFSFELAEKRLGADSVSFAAASSSAVKGETLLDTARNLEAMGIDTVVVRHGASGAARLLAERLAASVVNAGDGAHEHPTQGLLDLLTIRARRGRVEGLRVVLVGDVLHSRVARSNLWGLRALGARVGVCGPPTLLPRGLTELGVDVFPRIEEALAEADVLNVLRIQLERQKAHLFPSLREYRRLFGVTRERIEAAGRDVLVLHPGPMNRGVEIDSDVADGPCSAILEQVSAGVAVRMAVLCLLAGVDPREAGGGGDAPDVADPAAATSGRSAAPARATSASGPRARVAAGVAEP